MLIFLLIFFVLGAALGSFITNVSDRMKDHEQFIWGSSHCSNCKHQLSAWDLLPVLNYLYLKGRCRYCKKRFSARSFVVEVISGIGVLVVAYQMWIFLNQGSSLLETFLLGFFLISCWSILLLISLYDWDHLLILDVFTFPAMVFVTILQLFIWQFDLQALGYIFLASFLNTTILLGIVMVTRGRGMGLGDVKLGALIGLMTSFPLNLLALLMATCSGALYGVGLIIFRKKTLKQTIAFGPFLSLGAWVTLLYGGVIWEWYISIMVVV